MSSCRVPSFMLASCSLRRCSRLSRLSSFPSSPIPPPPWSSTQTHPFTGPSARGGGDECSRDRLRLRGALGAVVYDPVSRRVVFADADPPWNILLSSWRNDRRTYIAELETLAAISVYSTYPNLFKGRRVLHFIDNTVALSALVHGYSGKPDLAKQVNVFYLQMLSLRSAVYFDYVPSKANIADLPSRRMFVQLRSELAGLRGVTRPSDVLRVPSVASWSRPLARWADPVFPDVGFPM